MQGVVGYSPGVFDLFHVGHLDLLRRAGGECDRLVAGVLTDELAEELHGARPVVPLIERMEIVRNVRHVDEVVVLAEPGLRAAWESLGFDRVFTGCPDGVPAEVAERGLAGTGVRVVRYEGLAETGSPVLRGALGGARQGSGPRTSVA
ncbi:adenylyltransferase/cytidyltransferase family protein [Actinomadura rugatobispora]|uniref:ethanolamine-phosphate cytidylyltransferase n=1 Tax=Actinomadura rugatobispora TaxID=1994 RepID=A0ABW1ABA8_9ACTN|nr:adenylyltransferase/cytidyltransferase family protein [Actinomadura rugatobispora]